MNPHSELPKENLEDLRALCLKAPEGLIIEIGVYKGGSAFVLSQAANGRKLHLYDTFEGIPVRGIYDNMSVGSFADTNLDEVKALIPDAEFHVGFFPDTLTEDIKDIAFVHVDCDQYQACKDAIDLLYPRMVSGGIMAFDDYPFIGIKKAIHDAFGVNIEFSENNIPYVIKS